MAESFYEPVNDSQAKNRERGYTGGFGNGQDTALTNAFNNGGQSAFDELAKKFAGQAVKPTNVASQNVYQKNALHDMGKAPAPVDPRISQAYDNAGKSFDSERLQQFMNPYIDEVIGRNADNITRQYDVNRNRIDEDMAAAGGFGSSAQGVERSLTNEAESRQIGDMDAGLRLKGYEAAGRLHNSDVNNNLAVASGLSGFDQYGRQVLERGQDRQLFAGDRVQAQNQSVLDSFYRERDNEMQYPYQQSDYLRGVLGAFPTGQQQTTTKPYTGPGALQAGIGGALMGNSLYNAYGNSGSPNYLSTATYQPNNLPWLAGG